MKKDFAGGENRPFPSPHISESLREASLPGSKRQHLQPTEVAQVVQHLHYGASIFAVARGFVVGKRHQKIGQYARRSKEACRTAI